MFVGIGVGGGKLKSAAVEGGAAGSSSSVVDDVDIDEDDELLSMDEEAYLPDELRDGAKKHQLQQQQQQQGGEIIVSRSAAAAADDAPPQPETALKPLELLLSSSSPSCSTSSLVVVAAAAAAATSSFSSSSPPPPPPPPPLSPVSPLSSPLPSLNNNYEAHLPKYSESELSAAVERAVAAAAAAAAASDSAARLAPPAVVAVAPPPPPPSSPCRSCVSLTLLSKSLEESYSRERLSDASDHASDKAKALADLEAEHGRYVSDLQSKHAFEFAEVEVGLDRHERELDEKLRLAVETNQTAILKDAAQKQKSLTDANEQKDMMLAAVGRELHARAEESKSYKERLDTVEETLRRQSSELDEARQVARQREDERDAAALSHSADVALLNEGRRLAVDKMKLEMKSLAESQFAEANKHYHKLVAEDKAKGEELEALRAKAAADKKRHETEVRKNKFEVEELLASLAAAKAELLAVEARAMSTAAQAGKQLDEAQESRNAMELDLATARKERDEARMSLGVSVSKKDAELVDLNAMCEELMMMVEKCTCQEHN